MPGRPRILCDTKQREVCALVARRLHHRRRRPLRLAAARSRSNAKPAETPSFKKHFAFPASPPRLNPVDAPSRKPPLTSGGPPPGSSNALSHSSYAKRDRRFLQPRRGGRTLRPRVRHRPPGNLRRPEICPHQTPRHPHPEIDPPDDRVGCGRDTDYAATATFPFTVGRRTFARSRNQQFTSLPHRQT